MGLSARGRSVNEELARARDEIKRTVTMREVVRMVGLPDPDRSGKIRSPFNAGDRTPSLHLYDYDWYDYSTGQGGDQITFVQQVAGVSYIQALQVLSRNMSLAVKPRKYDHDMPFEVADFTKKFNDEEDGTGNHTDEWAALVKAKWPTLEVLDLYAMGCKITRSGDLWIPHWVYDPEAGRRLVRGIKVRHLPAAAKSAVTGSTFTIGLYRPFYRLQNKTHALVVEGESDAWVMQKMLMHRDVTVLALPSGASTLKSRYIDELQSFSTVGLALDDDEPGQKARDWLADGVWPRGYAVKVPGGRVAEAAADGWTL